MSNVPDRVARFADHLRAADPMAQTILFRPEAWTKALGDNEHLASVLTVCGPSRTITRANLATIGGDKINDTFPLERLFIAAMIWGFGDRGYGGYRTQLMLADLKERTRLAKTGALLREGKLGEAYEGFRVKQCGPAFFTKFFYAVGLGAALDPLPLVLDSRVAASLRKIAKDGELDAAQLVRGQKHVHRFPEGYARYVALLNDWAHVIGCRPDAIEMLLFKPPASFDAPLDA